MAEVPRQAFPGGAREEKEFEEKVVQVNRVSKKTKGGNRISFSVLTIVGDKKGKVGVGLGKAPDVVSGIKKGFKPFGPSTNGMTAFTRAITPTLSFFLPFSSFR